MDDPFFIIGFQRSGTTLLRLMLNRHPLIAIPLDVVGLWQRYHDRLAVYGDLNSCNNARKLVADLLKEERIQLWEVPLSVQKVMEYATACDYPSLIAGFYRAYAASKGKSHWGDKDPGNMTRLHLLNEWFPSCRFIHIIRDGRDACLSQLDQEFGFDELLPCAEAWREEVWWVRCIGRMLGPPRYMEIKYENLVSNPDIWLEAICEFLHISYCEDMLRYHEDVRGSIPDSKRHIWPLITRPPTAQNVRRWTRELNKAQVVCFEKRASSLLRELDYPISHSLASGAYTEEFRYIVRVSIRALRHRLAARIMRSRTVAEKAAGGVP